MISFRDIITITDGTTDYSVPQSMFNFEASSFPMTSGTTYTYVGYYKELNKIFFNVSTPVSSINAMTFERWNGSSWVAITKFYDFTRGFSKSGYIAWDRAELEDGWTTTSVSGLDVRYRITVNTAETPIFKGIGMLLCSEDDLAQEDPRSITDNLIPDSNTDQIPFISESTNEIINELDLKGYMVFDSDNAATPDDIHNKNAEGQLLPNSLGLWDLLKHNELVQACKFLALSKIYGSAADSSDDGYVDKRDYYMDIYKEKLNKNFSLDLNDDGEMDNDELKVARSFTFIR